MTSENTPEIEEEQFETEVIGSSIPVVVDFYSTECAPCEAVAPKFEALARLYGQHVKFLKIFRQGNLRRTGETKGNSRGCQSWRGQSIRHPPSLQFPGVSPTATRLHVGSLDGRACQGCRR